MKRIQKVIQDIKLSSRANSTNLLQLVVTKLLVSLIRLNYSLTSLLIYFNESIPFDFNTSLLLYRKRDKTFIFSQDFRVLAQEDRTTQNLNIRIRVDIQLLKLLPKGSLMKLSHQCNKLRLRLLSK